MNQTLPPGKKHHTRKKDRGENRGRNLEQQPVSRKKLRFRNLIGQHVFDHDRADLVGIVAGQKALENTDYRRHVLESFVGIGTDHFP